MSPEVPRVDRSKAYVTPVCAAAVLSRGLCSGTTQPVAAQEDHRYPNATSNAQSKWEVICPWGWLPRRSALPDGVFGAALCLENGDAYGGPDRNRATALRGLGYSGTDDRPE